MKPRLIALAIGLLALCATTAPATDYIAVGNGYYRNGGAYYQVQQVYYAAGWHGGAYYQAGYYPAYVQVQYTPPAVNVRVNFTAKDADWKTKMLELVKAREEEAYFQQALKLAGLNGSGGAYASPYGGYGSLSYGSAVTTTGFGYSAASINDLYRQTDVNALFQQLAQGTKDIRDLAGQAQDAHAQAVDAEAARNARLLEIRARSAAVTQFLQSIQQPTTTTVQGISSSGPVAPQPAPAPVSLPNVAQAGDLWARTLADDCASCHSGKTIGGGFDVAKFDSLSREYKLSKLLPRLLPTADPAVRMPKGKAPLPMEKIHAAALKFVQ